MSATTASDLPARVASALVMAVFALGTAWWGGLPFALFWSVVASAVFVEFRAMASGKPVDWGSAALVFAVIAAICVGIAWPVGPGFVTMAVFVATAGALVAGAMVAGIATPVVARADVAAFAYALILAIVPTALRSGVLVADGLAAIVWLFAVVWGTDIFAYFGGRGIGGPKLWPAVSPKKTWSGFLVGTGCGALAGLAVIAFWPWPLGQRPGLFGWFVLSLVTAIASQGGDLLESHLKRSVGAKDSGALIPGHGGVMDRVDGFWAGCVVVGLLVSLLFIGVRAGAL